MILTNLTYHEPTNLEEAREIMNEHANDFIVLGGGTMIIPQLTRNEVLTNHVLNLQSLGLDNIVDKENYVRIEAMVTYTDVLNSPIIKKHLPLLKYFTLGVTGGNQIRNQGTLVGSACFANPSSEILAILLALS